MSLVRAQCGDPFAILGMHPDGDGGQSIRVWWRGARALRWRRRDGDRSEIPLRRVHEDGLYEGHLPDYPEAVPYEILVDAGDGVYVPHRDPYSFWPQLSDFDLERIQAGQHHHLEQVLGAHLCQVDGAWGVRFAVWAPDAQRVSVIGDWNGFDGRYHPMRKRHPVGVWELFIPQVAPGMLYKYDVLGCDGIARAKADPCARVAEIPPATASIVAEPDEYQWHDDAWMQARPDSEWWRQPMAIYEVHPGSWQRGDNDQHLSWTEMGQRLVEHCRNCGFTHVEFLPLSAHPYEGSWGYQVSGYFAPNSRHGSPLELKAMVDMLHQAGIGVIVDFVPAHFPKDAFALARFDGTACYEYADPREGEHKEWGTLIFNYKRPEVRNFLLASALFWLREFHIDGLRVDAVSAMLYRNYDRSEGEWLRNEEGGNANLEAVSFLQELNATVHNLFKGVVTCAEESTAWQGTTAPTEWQGLGFDLKWNMGWMHDTLRYLSQDPVMRSGSHNLITFHQWYAYDEKWILPLSHDEVVHGKGSLLDKMRGDYGQRLASLRLLYGYQVAVPGRKLLFQGAEIGQGREWSWQRSIDWHEGEFPERQNLCRFLSAALALYGKEAALHGNDDQRAGFQWVDDQNPRESILAFLRRAPGARDVLVACNFTPVPRHAYPLGLPQGGAWEVLLNSDEQRFGGSGSGASGTLVSSESESLDGWPAMLRLPLAPLSICFLAPAPSTGE